MTLDITAYENRIQLHGHGHVWLERYSGTDDDIANSAEQEGLSIPGQALAYSQSATPGTATPPPASRRTPVPARPPRTTC